MQDIAWLACLSGYSSSALCGMYIANYMRNTYICGQYTAHAHAIIMGDKYTYLGYAFIPCRHMQQGVKQAYYNYYS